MYDENLKLVYIFELINATSMEQRGLTTERTAADPLQNGMMKVGR